MQGIKNEYTDILVIGGGLAGLRAAAAAAGDGVRVMIASKGQSASPEIMGFDVPVKAEDTPELYVQDTNASGYGINDSRLARVLAEQVMGQVKYLESLGVEFDRDSSGNYDAIHTLGTSYPRLIHCKSKTGTQGMRVMHAQCERQGTVFRNATAVLALLTEKDRVLGALAFDSKSKELICILAKAVVLATGGCGAIQRISTYPSAIIGDGYAMALRAGAELVDMEFQQFEPCAFIHPPEIAGKVIATTLLRHGAQLLNADMREFMPDYGLTRANVRKNTLARAMVAEVKAGRGSPHGGIYYNMTMMAPKFLYEDHKIFTRPAVEVGMDLTKEMPEMMPAAHTNMGGVCITTDCKTRLSNLFACGEVTGGLHGADRIGGSAGAETVVFGAIAGESAALCAREAAEPDAVAASEALSRAVEQILAYTKRSSGGHSAADIRADIGQIMTEHVGISRNKTGLSKAKNALSELSERLNSIGAASLEEAVTLYHCENMLLLATIQVEASLLREESRGVFYRDDFPNRDDENWRRNIVVRSCGETIKLDVHECAQAPEKQAEERK